MSQAPAPIPAYAVPGRGFVMTPACPAGAFLFLTTLARFYLRAPQS